MNTDLPTQLPAHVDNVPLALKGQHVTHKRTTAWISPHPAPRTQKSGHSRRTATSRENYQLMGYQLFPTHPIKSESVGRSSPITYRRLGTEV
jgi:hypothetical protein